MEKVWLRVRKPLELLFLGRERGGSREALLGVSFMCMVYGLFSWDVESDLRGWEGRN